jgi:hypothetical protein
MSEIAEMTEAESFRRGVFPYTIGGVRAIVDPLKALNRIYEAEPAFDDLVARFFTGPAGDEDASAQSRRAIDMVSTALALESAVLAGFKLQPLADDGSGASITECMDLLAEFLVWQDRRETARQEAEERRAAAVATAEAKAREALEAAIATEANPPSANAA